MTPERPSSPLARSVGFVIPVYNEEATLEALHEAITLACRKAGVDDLAICFVDDGSTDASWSVIERLCTRFPDITTALHFRRNFGKADALQAGFSHLKNEVIFTIDADLQDDPDEIPRFLEKLDEGYDLVSGWKKVRRDPLAKTLPSKVFNTLARFVSGVQLHDFNCGFKAYRREVTQNVRLFGELHRFVPILAHAEGFRIGEIAVNHHPRTHGLSKYGGKRFIKGLLDLVTVVVMSRYLRRPAHIFGGAGGLLGMVGFLVLLWLSCEKIIFGNSIGDRPLLFLGILLMLMGTQLISLGLVAELIIRQNFREPKNHTDLRI